MRGLTKEVKKRARKEIAAQNAERWNSLTTEQKVTDLDLRLGKGQGAVKQRARLQALLEEEAQASVVKETKTAKKTKKKESK